MSRPENSISMADISSLGIPVSSDWPAAPISRSESEATQPTISVPETSHAGSSLFPGNVNEAVQNSQPALHAPAKTEVELGSYLHAPNASSALPSSAHSANPSFNAAQAFSSQSEAMHNFPSTTAVSQAHVSHVPAPQEHAFTLSGQFQAATAPQSFAPSAQHAMPYSSDSPNLLRSKTTGDVLAHASRESSAPHGTHQLPTNDVLGPTVLPPSQLLQPPAEFLPGTTGQANHFIHTPGGLQLAFSDMSESVSADSTGPSGAATSAVLPSQAVEAAALFPRIGGVIDELATTAADARVHFHGGQTERCSEALNKILQMLRTIGDYGAQSLAGAVAYQRQRNTPGTTTTSLSAEQEKQLYSAALFSTLPDSSGMRKRRVSVDTDGEAPIKSLRMQPGRQRSRSELGASPYLRNALRSAVPQGVFDFTMLPTTFESSLRETPTEPSALMQAMSLPASPVHSTNGRQAPNTLQSLVQPENDQSVSGRVLSPLAPQEGWEKARTPQGDQGHFDTFDFNIDETRESTVSGDRTIFTNDFTSELRTLYDHLFNDFLSGLCTNLDATDDRGEPIHQTLMPKKMARLDESPDFRPFKFRIQAFTNAFQSKLQSAGVSEEDHSLRKIKQYLWSHPFISRFNEDGRKAKSKGNHIWIIEAKRLPDGGWTFRSFTPKIAGPSSTMAHVGEPWSWNLRVWDPQGTTCGIKVVYTTNKLPSWIRWKDDEKVLTGTPTSSSDSGEVSVTALYVHLDQLHRLEHSFYLQVLPNSDDVLLKSEAPAQPVSSFAPHPASASLLASVCAAPTPPQAPTTSASAAATAAAAVSTATAARSSLAPPPAAGQPAAPTPQVSVPSSLPESTKYEVLDLSRASDVLSSMPFPFSPPIHTDSPLQPPFTFGHSVMAPKTVPNGPQTAIFVDKSQLQPSALPHAAQPASVTGAAPQAGGLTGTAPPMGVVCNPPVGGACTPGSVVGGGSTPSTTAGGGVTPDNLVPSTNALATPASAPGAASSLPGPGLVTSPSVNSPALFSPSVQSPVVQSPPNTMATDSTRLHLFNLIEQRQREQASSFSLLMPQRQPGFTPSEHPGQSTPMSNMPNDMGASLPQV